MTYAYDPVGNRSTLLDQNSGATTYSYDARNRLTAVLNPFAETTNLKRVLTPFLGEQSRRLGRQPGRRKGAAPDVKR